MTDGQLVSKSGLKAEYGLTDAMVRELGAADATVPNPHYRKAAPMQLYRRDRVEKWIAEHGDLLEAAQPRKQAAARVVETKRARARAEVSTLVKSLRLRRIVDRAELEEMAIRFYYDRYADFAGELTEKGLCSFIRHNLTNYEDILDAVKGKVGAGELYEDVKVYLCCRIVREYGLTISPLGAAFGDLSLVGGPPKRYQGTCLEARLARLLGLEARGNDQARKAPGEKADEEVPHRRAL